MSLTKDDIVKALAKGNGYQLNQSVELIEPVHSEYKIDVDRPRALHGID